MRTILILRKPMRVLLSHDTVRDFFFVERLAEKLRPLGVEPRCDNLKASSGEYNDDCLRRQLKSYQFIVPVLSAAYVQDSFLKRELLEAIALEKNDGRRFILPLLVDDCDVPFDWYFQDRIIDVRGERRPAGAEDVPMIDPFGSPFFFRSFPARDGGE